MAFAIGMAHVVSIHRALFANLTKLTHENPPPHGASHIKPCYSITYFRKKQALFLIQPKRICPKRVTELCIRQPCFFMDKILEILGMDWVDK